MHSLSANIVEYVEFESREGVADSEVLSALKQTDAILHQIDGFVHRYLARRDSTWVEVVFWYDRNAADAGLEVFKADDRSAALFSLIEEGSVSIRYSDLLN